MRCARVRARACGQAGGGVVVGAIIQIICELVHSFTSFRPLPSIQ